MVVYRAVSLEGVCLSLSPHQAFNHHLKLRRAPTKPRLCPMECLSSRIHVMRHTSLSYSEPTLLSSSDLSPLNFLPRTLAVRISFRHAISRSSRYFQSARGISRRQKQRPERQQNRGPKMRGRNRRSFRLPSQPSRARRAAVYRDLQPA